MRFAITVTDRCLGVFQALVERGWVPLRVFTTEVDRRVHHNAAVIDMTLFVRRAVGWTEAHAFPPATVVHVNNLAMVVAVADGYVGLTDWSLIAGGAVTGTPRR